MKILILANSDIGLYKFRKELIENLLLNHEVYICLPEGQYISNLMEKGCKYILCECLQRHGTNPFVDIKLVMFYKKVLKAIKPDFVFTYTIKPNVYGGMACASARVPYITNITGLGMALENEGVLQKITLFLYRYGLRRARKVFFQNVNNCEFMLEHDVVKTAYDLLPGSGVNLSQYKLMEYPKGENIEFAFIARIMKEKGINQYLDMAKQIKIKFPNTVFHVCGFCETDYEDELEKLESQGIIKYHGLVDDMTKIYEKISCTIHPSYYPEGLSNVLLESAASGRAIITTNRSGCAEVIDDGINGFIVKQQDSKDLIEKVEQFLMLTWEERRDMGLAGRRKVEKEFDRQIVVNKYLEEIKNGHC